jgi:BirA family transcriptional regulator, biotin operon repressor / biotin---[acetyl-CoA-carboxylase] ligase
MNVLGQTLLHFLADGGFYSGTALGEKTGRSRTAIWKAIQSLQKNGVVIYSVRGKGYRLAEPLELLNKDVILAALRQCEQKNGEPPEQIQLDVFDDIKSTNAYLLSKAKTGNVTAQACLAEQQHAGRGRRGRDWVSPFGGNIYLSLLWQFHTGVSQLGGLSLAIAIAVLRALREVGLTSAGVKWPNDILVDGRKLSGILLELAGESSGPCAVVMGVGLNVRMAKSKMTTVEQPWTDMESALGRPIARNEFAAQLLHQLVSACKEFEAHGLAPFLAEWRQYDLFAEREVTVQLPKSMIQGVVKGIDVDGALLLLNKGQIQRFHGGEISLRLREPSAL